jgi:hypothetical protein
MIEECIGEGIVESLKMDDIFDQAWSAAEKTVGPEIWERLSDAMRIHAVQKQICRMKPEQMQGRPLVGDSAPRYIQPSAIR